MVKRVKDTWESKISFVQYLSKGIGSSVPCTIFCPGFVRVATPRVLPCHKEWKQTQWGGFYRTIQLVCSSIVNILCNSKCLLFFCEVQSNTCPFFCLPFWASDFCWRMCHFFQRNPFKMNKTFSLRSWFLPAYSMSFVSFYLWQVWWLCSHADFYSCEVEDNRLSVGAIMTRVQCRL